jgi:zinc transport system substrate-binding protein
MRGALATAVLLSLVLPLGCAREEVPSRIQVTCSIFPLGDLAQNIGKDHVDIRVLIPPGASPHVFEPSAQEFKSFASAKVFVMVGAGFEFWAEKLVTSSSSESLVVVRASEGLELIPLGVHADHGEPVDSEQGNPHIWLDPIVMKRITERIARAFTEVDPAHASEYLGNANEYCSVLDSLDSEIRRAVEGFTTREYVAFHPAWSYFARRYGLKEVGIIQESPGREPTPRELKRIVDDIRRFKIRAVFAEPQFSPKAATTIAEEAGVEVLLLDPIGGEGVPERDSYLKLMRYNLNIMRKAINWGDSRSK